jgi:outer membrane protein with beta-barrel domain
MHRVVASTVSIVASLLWLGSPSMANAQQREKWWVGISTGVGSVFSSSREDEGSRTAVVLGYIDLGGWVHRQWRIGVDFGSIDVDTPADLDEDMTADFISVTAAYYPRPASGVHIKGGLGASFPTLGIVDEFGTTATAGLGAGLGLAAGAGWDLNLGRRFWLTPALSFRYARPVDLVLAGRTRVADWTYKAVDVTVGVRFD